MIKNNKPIDLSKVTIGSDPEFFLFSELQNKFISPIGMYEGTKDKPTPITDKGHMIQIDGVSCEVNIPPCSTPQQFINELKVVVDHIKNNIALPQQLVISNCATAMFTDDQLNCAEAWEIGCQPDFSAWTMNMNHPKQYEDNLRACGKNDCHLN